MLCMAISLSFLILTSMDTHPDPGEKEASYGAKTRVWLAFNLVFGVPGVKLSYSSSPITARNCRSCKLDSAVSQEFPAAGVRGYGEVPCKPRYLPP